MVETKPYKTKLCVLYQSGRCGRQTCTFAHGDGELRRHSGSFPERPSDRGNDLRNKLDRKHSPQHRYSPGRDSRGSHAYRRIIPPAPTKRRRYRTHDQMDGQSDLSGTFRSSYATAYCSKDKKFVSSDSRIKLEDELKQVEYEVNVLLDGKNQLEIELVKRVQEADSLSSRIRDLEAQLSEEKDRSSSVISKIKKLISAHVHCSGLEDEIKRCQVQLEKVVQELGMDAAHIGASEDHLYANIIRDEAVPELKDHSSIRRPLSSTVGVQQGSKSADTVRGQGVRHEVSGRFSYLEFDGNGEAEVGSTREDIARMSSERKPRRKDTAKSSDKLKILESNLVAPSTSMAAHAIDDFVELIEADGNTEVVGSPDSTKIHFQFLVPPLPPVTKNNYSQYEEIDDNVDVDGLHEHEEVDIM